ncbi:MAG: hypothetical protein C4K58_05425 [Flavobacteriaceae bacterium]|nr:MAG: hypothetical protein C4K58_05425 [Flavobacteriaceae bacterium]
MCRPKRTSHVQKGISGKNTLVTNSRHYAALSSALELVIKIEEGISLDIPSDLIAMDIRQCILHLSEVTGNISTDDLLGNIFGSFCIGK